MSRTFGFSGVVLVVASLVALPALARAQLVPPVIISITLLPTGSGGESCSTNAAECGSNVSRNADTTPKECVATYSDGHKENITCPPGFSQSSSGSSSSGTSGSGTSSGSSNTTVKKP